MTAAGGDAGSRDRFGRAPLADALRVGEPRMLLDPRFIATLHGELEAELGVEEASLALFQIGFLNGLRAASQVLEASFAGPDPMAEVAAGTPLAIRFAPAEDRRCGTLELRGSWPERGEAFALLERSGVAGRSRCSLTAGYTSGWLSGLLDANVLALESRCRAAGDARCEFVAREEETWRGLADERAVALLNGLPFESFREMIAAEQPEPAAPAGDAAARFDPEAAAVHIWGPVMVLPFCGTEEALRAVDLIGRDPGARQVSVVVVDLSGAIVDEGFGAVALEQIVDTAEALGADTILAGVSPLCEALLADLRRPPLLVHKDVHQAIAAAFQIARAQARAV